MQDPDIERLLRRYRPLAPTDALSDQITKSPNHEITKSVRTWPWAMAAAALLALTIGLHASARSSSLPDEDRIDERRVEAVADDLGGPGNRPIAEWIVREETRAERAAQSHRAESLGGPGVPQ